MYKKVMKVSNLNTLCTGHGDHSSFLPDEAAKAGENSLFNHTHNPVLTG